MYINLVVLIFNILIFEKCDGARILGVVPMPSYSHQVPFHPVFKELSLRGHQVTFITTDAINDPKLTNLTEIVIKDSYEALKRNNLLDAQAKHGIIKFLEVTGHFFEDLFNVQLSHPEVKKLINDPQVKFDLVIFEAMTPPLAFSWRFDCPSVGMASMDAHFQYHYLMGNPIHPLITPDFNLKINDTENMTFRERFISATMYVVYMILGYVQFIPLMDSINQKHFGKEVPSISEQANRVDMLLITQNPIFNDVRPLYPHTITIGNGLHIQPPKPLPKDLKQYLDNNPEGVVYFSLGTNVKGNLLTQAAKNAIYEAFSELPYKFLIKVDWTNLTVPKNVKVEKWLPQQDVLRHPNIKLFITQGGLQSLQEAVTNGIPLVGIPFFGDQFMNVQKVIKRGYGIKIDRHQITKESVKEAINEVLSNPTYKEKALEMKDYIQDEPMTSLEKAIWWIEYVIRHKGAPLLKNKASTLPLYKYFFLDIIAAVLIFLVSLSYLLYKTTTTITKMIYSLYCKRKNAKRTKLD